MYCELGTSEVMRTLERENAFRITCLKNGRIDFQFAISINAYPTSNSLNLYKYKSG
jgi:hypothetical protein